MTVAIGLRSLWRYFKAEISSRAIKMAPRTGILEFTIWVSLNIMLGLSNTFAKVPVGRCSTTTNFLGTTPAPLIAIMLGWSIAASSCISISISNSATLTLDSLFFSIFTTIISSFWVAVYMYALLPEQRYFTSRNSLSFTVREIFLQIVRLWRGKRKLGFPSIEVGPLSVVILLVTSEGDWGCAILAGFEVFSLSVHKNKICCN